MLNPRLLSAAALGFVLAATGCSFSDSSRSSAGSSESSSTSIGSLSASSVGKGLSDKDKNNYSTDVANLTYSVAGSGMSATAFANALSRTAQKFHITNWAGEKATFTGIGKGLKKARVPKEQIANQPFLGTVLGANKDALSLIRSGYSD
jgi:hypothetical protein